MTNALVNIILPILNRPEHTEQCLRSLYATTNPELFDLTIIDDGSDQHTKSLIVELNMELAQKYRTRPAHLITRKEGESMGPGFSRNEGAQFVTKTERRGKYIYHCDNDVFYRDGWLDKLLAAYEVVSRDGVALLGASCHPYLQNNETRDYQALGIKVGIKDAVSGYSQLMTWEIWDRFGEYHTQEGLEKKTGRSDDWEYCQRITKAGLLVGAVEPELVIPCGKTDTYGDPAVGQETFKNYEGVIIK
jgi:glycosyltransferase involved in cell wall biosynthesis